MKPAWLVFLGLMSVPGWAENSFVERVPDGRTHDGRMILHAGNYAIYRTDELKFGEAKPLVAAFLPLDASPNEAWGDPILWSRELNYTLAIFPYSNQAQLAQLSQSTHVGSGLACGRVKLLRPDLNLNQSTNRVSVPIYDARARLGKVRSILDGVSEASLKASIASLEGMGTRYHTSTTGLKTPDAIKSMLIDVNQTLDIKLYPHLESNQASVIARIPGVKFKDEIVILGAHLDSISRTNLQDAPGADDDATGIASLIEVARLIHKSGATFARTIEIHAYGAEEVGLIGSGEIAEAYAQANKNVVAQFQLDMTGYFDPALGPKIHLITTDTDLNVTFDLKELASTYLGSTPFSLDTLSAGTSDHQSWLDNGYPTGFAFEHPTKFNPTYHSGKDKSSAISDLTQTVIFTQLSMAFLAHQAGLMSAESEYAAYKESLESSDDFKLAVFGGGSGHLYQVAVASAKKLSYLHFCRIDNQKSKSCIGPRAALFANGGLNGHPIYASGTKPSVSLVSGDYRVLAYDSDHALVALREVRLD